MDPLDGNAVGGVLEEALGVDLTAVVRKCTSCGAEATLAELVAYVGGPGAVLRCASCGAVSLRVVTTPGRVLVEVRRTPAES